MRIASLGLLLIFSCAATAQAVWKYVDEQGVTHYTDQPVPGAQKIELRSGSAATSSANQASSSASTTNVSQQGEYRTFEIVKPSDQGSVVNTGGVLQVSIQLAPAVQPGHTVKLYLDGNLVEGYPRDALEYEVPDVPRGIHTLLGVILDANDRRVLESNKVTFTMRQKSIAVQPPVGPTLRPPSKPPAPRPPVQSTQPSFADLKPKSATAKQ
jgi:hypothetical protein